MLSHRVENDLHTILLIGGMAILLGLIGYLLFGTIGLVILVLGGIFFVITGTLVTPKLVLRIYKVKPVIVNLPLILTGKGAFSWIDIALLIFAPNIATMLQLGLSRAREYNTDVGAVDLTKDPYSLASALQKLEKLHTGLLQKIILPGRKLSEPSLLRTHPHTEDRIKRLELMAQELRQDNDEIVASNSWQASFLPNAQAGQSSNVNLKGPRWHLSGLWY